MQPKPCVLNEFLLAEIGIQCPSAARLSALANALEQRNVSVRLQV